MEKLTNEEIENFLNEKEDKLDNESLQQFFNPYFQKKAVLGFDIYRYSKYPLTEQSLIPYIFKILYENTIVNCLKHEKFIFQQYDSSKFDDNFIDTGDGGFQIFNTPFESLIFAIYFQANIQRYNSSFIPKFKHLRDLVGELTLRYSLTFDLIYTFNDNFYGPAIINNARIIAKDKLNRFLVDENTHLWFRKNINGIENLIVLAEADFQKIEPMRNFNFDNFESYFFDSDRNELKILNVDLLKIGEITSKLDIVSIYSLRVQAFMISDGRELRKIVVTIGNLNSSGIIGD
ncbi:MAG: hypothetical protein Q8T08_23265 [Ignavibacteria bacterium]|nr:hypothetical protein [Ignavibacteria bacterium]